MRLQLKELRSAAGISQDKLAQESGISRVTISKIEQGEECELKTSTLVKLASALGVSVPELFSL